MKRNSLHGVSLVDGLASVGRHAFTSAEAQGALGTSDKATQAKLRRLRARGEIATPLRGYHVILSPEYRGQGCRPPIQVVDGLATHLGFSYYVALLSAAELHGAAHQRPQRFQIMLPVAHRTILCGLSAIDCAVRHNLPDIPVIVRNTPTGTVRVASPEATALDLVGYADRCGGLDNVATVLAELAERMDPDALAEVVGCSPMPWAQRLGHLLDRVGADALAEGLHARIADVERVVELDPARPMTGAPRDLRWRVAVNIKVEVE